MSMDASPAPPTQAEIRAGLSHIAGLSPAVQAILPRLCDDDFEADELSRMIGQDPVLAARVLRLANSPFFGLPRQVGSLRDAVLILGFSNLRGLVLSTGLIGAFQDAAASMRSLTTAAAAGALARALRRDAGLAFTAGLLHNLGELLLGHFAPAHWRPLAGDATAVTMDARLAEERRVFGFDHCELGAEIAGHWRFPAAIQAAIRLYPVPPETPEEPLADLVHVAWTIATTPADDPPNLAPGVMARLALARPEGLAAITAAGQAARESRVMLGTAA